MFTDLFLKNDKLSLPMRVWAAHVNACVANDGAATCLPTAEVLRVLGIDVTGPNKDLVASARQALAKKGLLVAEQVSDADAGFYGWKHLAKW